MKCKESCSLPAKLLLWVKIDKWQLYICFISSAKHCSDRISRCVNIRIIIHIIIRHSCAWLLSNYVGNSWSQCRPGQLKLWCRDSKTQRCKTSGDRWFPSQRASNHYLQWLHNDHDGVSNHQPRGCLLNRLLRRRSKKTSKLRVTVLCMGNSPGPVNSPHKGPVTRKMFPFDDVIIWWKRSHAMTPQEFTRLLPPKGS